jgi:DNA modification methylase
MANKYNDLSGKEWLQYSFSIWRNIRKEDEERKLQHPAMFPIQLADRIIDIFSKREDLILDPFMGTGSTIIAAYRKKRNSIGFELSSEYVSIFAKRLNEEKSNLLNNECYEPIVYTKDARELLEYVNKESIHLCITSPPYWDILNMSRTADRKEIKNYSESKTDLGNINDYNEFLYELGRIFIKVYQN